MTSSRPYLLQAIHDWLTDNKLTPYLLVDAEYEDVYVPVEYIQDGKIILNISYSAVQMLDIQSDCITFHARFSGKPMDIYIPMDAALALYAMENGKGMVFPEEAYEDAAVVAAPALSSVPSSNPQKDGDDAKPKKKKKSTKAPFLKVVK
jgi:stringent starvation protein B